MMTLNNIHSNHPGDYEKKDVSVRSVVVTSIISIVVIVFMLVVLFDYFLVTKEIIILDQMLKPVSQQLINLRSSEDSILTTYELIDSTKKTYRVPIEQAKKLFLSESAGTDK